MNVGGEIGNLDWSRKGPLFFSGAVGSVMCDIGAPLATKRLREEKRTHMQIQKGNIITFVQLGRIDHN